ncbi:uncharacterized protein LOC117171980 isoform X2 [Belonocnema kinseyi]|nr:uncharacterized protein LOC117171980 isoform X2 [Belonocnema kinseyi]
MKSLSTKKNIFYGGTPYMPILMENILNYIELEDFEFERIKEIQTVGFVYGVGWEAATLFNNNLNNQASIKLTFECCKYEYLSETGYQPDLKIPCKVYGRLINFEGKPLIEVHRLSKINDPEGSLKTITMLSKIVRQKYHYYVCSTDPQW